MKRTFFFLLFVGLNSFAATPFHTGTWKGYCDALGSDKSHIGTYSFNSDLTGSYKTEIFNGLRCQGNPEKTTEIKFIFKTKEAKDMKGGKVEMTFEKGHEFSNGNYTLLLKGNVLAVKLDGPKGKGDRQIGFPFHYVREI